MIQLDDGDGDDKRVFRVAGIQDGHSDLLKSDVGKVDDNSSLSSLLPGKRRRDLAMTAL